MVETKSLEVDIFSVISNPARRKIIKLLAKKPMKMSYLANTLNVSLQSLQKHVNKLCESGLAQRSNPNIILTPVGHDIIAQIESIEFLQGNADFFKEHSVLCLPEEFAKRIGELANSKAVSGYVATVEECRVMCEQAAKFANFLAASVSLDVYGNHFPKLRDKGIKIRYVMGENAIIPKGWLNLTKKVGEEKMIQNGTLKRKMIKKMPVEMLVTDKSAFFIFPDNSCIADQSVMFVSKDEKFRRWCEDLFEYYWKKSNCFVESKIHET